MAGLVSADAPQVNRAEAQAAVFGAPAKGIDAQVISQVQRIKAEQAKSAKNAAVELARLNLDGNVKKWEGDRGDTTKDRFVDKNLGDRAKKATAQINQAKRGMELLALDPSQQATRFAELKTNNLIDAGTMSVDQYVDSACTTIANLGVFDVCFPDIAANTSPAERVQLVKDSLAKNPAMRTFIGDLMGQAQEKMAAFSQPPETQTDQLDKQITDETGKRTIARGNLDQIIKNTLGIKPADLKGARKAAMDTAIANGDRDAVKKIVLEIKGFTADEITAINDYNEDMSRLKGQRDALNNANATTLPVIQAEIRRLDKIKTAGPPPKAAEYNGYQVVIDSPPFTGNIDAVRDADVQIQQLQETKSKLPLNIGEKQAAAKRHAEEEAVVIEMENLLDKVLLKTYDYNVDSYRDAKVANAEQAIKDAEAANRVDEATMYTNRLKVWIEKAEKGAPKKVHIEQIMKDMTILEKSGDRGMKFLIARDAGLFTGHKITIIDASGNSRDATGQEIIDWVYAGTISAEEAVARLDSGRTDRLNQLLVKKDEESKSVDSGVIEDYRNTLIGDYMTTLRHIRQTRLGRALSFGTGSKRLQFVDATGMRIEEGTFGTEIFKQFEQINGNWGEISKNYNGGEIDAALEKDANSKKFMDKMRAKGIVAEPKLKWALYLLLMAGAFAIPGLGLGALGGAGLGSAAIGAEVGSVAAAAAGLKIGQATKEQIIQ